ncbi:MAG TPA: hypothetical protein DDW49_02360, partial [Deltaproteobacteria bacterium]|nr:hypothetical protein [Deltaproteobacteria bacterium]
SYAEQDWYWGYSCNHDFQNGSNTNVSAGPICNFSEVRMLRALKDTILDPYYSNHADQTRIYAYGHSMGASGSITWAMHYPQIFGIVYASEGMTDYAGDPVFRNENIGRWGPLATNNPVLNLGIEWVDGSNTAESIRALNGMGIWDYMDHKTIACDPNYQDMDTAFIIAVHGTNDGTIQPASQGYPFYDCMNDGRRGFIGEVNTGYHGWQGYAPADDINFRMFSFPWGDWEDGMPNTPGVDRSFPVKTYVAFSDSTSSDVGRTSGTAAYNEFLQWDVKTIVDQANRYEVSMYARGSSQIADVTPRRLQNFVVNLGQRFSVTLGSASPINVFADGDGVLTVPNVNIPTGGVKMVIIPN